MTILRLQGGQQLRRRLSLIRPGFARRISLIRPSLARHILAVETTIRVAGTAFIAVAVGAYDWRAGLAVAGTALILSTIDLRRTP